ncbi:MAG: type II toxin-antitoxin system prevent-host-death family antitoxin [Ilumatobacteraceae bacterium]
MDRIGIRDLRADVASTVKRAAAGERIVVTVGGKPTASSGPSGDGRQPQPRRPRRRGLVVPPARSDRPRASEPVPTFVTVRIDRVLRELRG